MDPELKNLIEEQGKAFDAFQKSTKEKLDKIESGKSVAQVEEKMDKILADYDKYKETVDKLHAEKQLEKSQGGVGGEMSKQDKEYQNAFNEYMRKGKNENALAELQKNRMNAMSVGSDPDGGYLVSPTLSSRIVETIALSNPIRQLADVQTITSDSLDIIEDPNDMTATPVGETGSRTDTDTPALYKANIPACEYYTFPKATQKLLDDASWDIEAWLAGKAARAFSNAESVDFITGSTPTRPRGITTYEMVADASFAWGKTGYITTGQASTLSGTGAELVDVIDALKDEYHAGAAFLMAGATLTALRKTRAGASGANNFLFWMPSLVPGQPDSIVGYPVYKSASMPAIGSNTYPIAFANFKQAYTIVDRAGVRVLRDPFTAKPYVAFYTTKRVGGGIVNFEAVKFVKCAS